MKKLFLSITAAICAATGVLAQPTFTSTNSSPVAGDVFYHHDCDTTGIRPGAAGTNVIWDMTSLVRNDTDSVAYFTCGASCDSFPSANLIAASSYGDTSYFNSSTANFSELGYLSGGSITRLPDSTRLFVYPLAYTNVQHDTAVQEFSGMGSYFRNTTYLITEYDGYGALKLPEGVIRNAARVKRTLYSIDSLDFGGIPFTDTNLSYVYTWYTPGFHNALVNVFYDTSGTGYLHTTGVEYYTGTGFSPVPAALATDAYTVANTAFTIAPNPAASTVSFRFTLQSAPTAPLTVADVTGRIVSSIPAADMKEGANTISLPVGQLAAGMYIVRLQTATGIETRKFTVVR